MKRALKIIRNILILIIILGAIGWVAYNRYKDKLAQIGQRKVEAVDTSIPVAVSKAKTGSIADSIILNGSVKSSSEVTIVSTINGKIKEILVKEGETVKKQAVLAYVDRSEAGLTFALAPIESTIDGVVKKVAVEQGAAVAPSMPLFQIIDMDSVEIVLQVPEKEVSRVKQGIPAQVSVVSYPKKIFLGRVSRLSPVVDPLSRTLEAKIFIDNEDHLLKPGMFGEVKLILNEKRGATLIPSDALIDRDGKTVTFLVNEGQAKQVDPRIDIIEGRWASATAGIKPGDRVIVIGQQNVNDGDKVNVTEEIE